ncbi:GDP-mannose 4,6-dehydratase [Allostella sp. ATCC 35155]|nr:GDP-mannose 4,6-dehydratase [Stella sp. ATCC 35155]
MSARPVCVLFGATGQDGRLLARRFAAGGYAVVGVSRRPEAEARRDIGVHGDNFAHLVGCFSASAGATAALLSATDPAVIVNVAGMSSVGASFERPMDTLLDNGQLNLFILEALRLGACRARYIFASSGELFGETAQGGASAAARPDPRSPYAVSKAAAAMVLRNYRAAYGVDAALAHLFPHESPLRPAYFVLPKLARAVVDLHKGRIARISLGRTDVVRDWGWAEDHMDAVYRQARLPVPLDLVIATGVGTSLDEMVRHGLGRFGFADDGRVVRDPAMVRPSDLGRSVGDPVGARHALGWRARVTGTAVLDRLIDAVCEAEATSATQADRLEPVAAP